MDTFVGLIILAIIFGIIKFVQNNKLENYDMNKVSIGKMAHDAGKSKSEIRRNLINGKYDKDFPEQR